MTLLKIVHPITWILIALVWLVCGPVVWWVWAGEPYLWMWLEWVTR